MQSNEGYHDDAEQWRLLFEGVVVFVDEPLSAYPEGYHDDDKDEEEADVNFKVYRLSL